MYRGPSLKCVIGDVIMNNSRLGGLYVLLMIFVLISKQTCADTWQQAGSARFLAEYDSNPTLSATYLGSVRRALVEPEYSIKGVLGNNELKTGIALQIERSSDESLSQNRDSPSVFLDWVHKRQGSEFGISSKYAEIATRDSVIDGTGTVPVASTRASRIVSARWNKSMSERNTLTVDGAYEDVSYQGGTYYDYSSKSGNLRLDHALSETSTASLSMTGEKYLPDGGGPSSELVYALVGLDWKVEQIEFNLQVGNFKGRNDAGPLGGASMHYIGQRTDIVLNARRQVTSSGLGGLVKVEEANGNLNYALGPRSNLGVDLGWRRNHDILINNMRSTVGIWLQRNINPTWNARMNYLRTFLSGGGGSGVSSYIVGASLIYTFSEF